MVVDDFHVLRSPLGPFEADSKLLIDAHAALPLASALQTFEPIARRYAQILERVSLIELIQLAPRRWPQLDRTAFSSGRRASTVKNISRALAGEGPDHICDYNE